MVSRKKRRPLRRRVGRVSYYLHHGGWHVYYRDGARQVRRRVADDEVGAERIAAQINSQLAAHAPTLLAFTPVTVAELRQRFLDHHEVVLRSSLATIRRYRAATQHLSNFALDTASSCSAHEIQGHAFASYLRKLVVAPNGHVNARRRPLRDKGVRYILECCRAMYGFAQRMRHLPPYAANPFADLRLDHIRIENSKAIFVFDATSELAFFEHADDWTFPIHFTLAKTGMRPGELVHLLIEEVDLERGWLHVRGKPSLGWRVKTGRDRPIPLIEELVAVLKRAIGGRVAGLVFQRTQYDRASSAAGVMVRSELEQLLNRRLAENVNIRTADRSEQAILAQRVWREAGIVKVDAVRSSFIRVMKAISHAEATCPKSWRHSFATLLQDAGVDPLVRQITLGHAPRGSGGALGMTSVYTHTRPETQRTEIFRALRIWPHTLHLAQTWAQGGA